MTDKKEEEKEVSAWDQLELSAKITIIIFAIFIGFPLSIGLILFIFHKGRVYFSDNLKRKI